MESFAENKLTFKTGLDFSATALRSSMPLLSLVGTRNESEVVKAAAEATARERIATFIVKPAKLS